MIMKLTELQRHKIDRAYENAGSVLREIKQKPLKGKQLRDMKILEAAVSSLEATLCGQ